ncbi:hypothetical protein KKG38_00920 [Patescibacteria group bacterium]|nr:hypothetical protein [Patescibacteria group bacterium]
MEGKMEAILYVFASGLLQQSEGVLSFFGGGTFVSVDDVCAHLFSLGRQMGKKINTNFFKITKGSLLLLDVDNQEAGFICPRLRESKLEFFSFLELFNWWGSLRNRFEFVIRDYGGLNSHFTYILDREGRGEIFSNTHIQYKGLARGIGERTVCILSPNSQLHQHAEVDDTPRRLDPPEGELNIGIRISLWLIKPGQGLRVGERIVLRNVGGELQEERFAL